MSPRTLSVSISAAAILTSAVALPALADDPIVGIASDRLDWSTTPEGVAFAPLSGDRFAESYMAMVRLPAGLVSPPHVKTSAMFGVVMEGTITHRAVGDGEELRLPPGAYYKVPGGVAHVSACVSDVDCVTFVYQDGAFDFRPVGQ